VTAGDVVEVVAADYTEKNMDITSLSGLLALGAYCDADVEIGGNEGNSPSPKVIKVKMTRQAGADENTALTGVSETQPSRDENKKEEPEVQQAIADEPTASKAEWAKGDLIRAFYRDYDTNIVESTPCEAEVVGDTITPEDGNPYLTARFVGYDYDDYVLLTDIEGPAAPKGKKEIADETTASKAEWAIDDVVRAFFRDEAGVVESTPSEAVVVGKTITLEDGSAYLTVRFIGYPDEYSVWLTDIVGPSAGPGAVAEQEKWTAGSSIDPQFADMEEAAVTEDSVPEAESMIVRPDLGSRDELALPQQSLPEVDQNKIEPAAPVIDATCEDEVVLAGSNLSDGQDGKVYLDTTVVDFMPPVADVTADDTAADNDAEEEELIEEFNTRMSSVYSCNQMVVQYKRPSKQTDQTVPDSSTGEGDKKTVNAHPPITSQKIDTRLDENNNYQDFSKAVEKADVAAATAASGAVGLMSPIVEEAKPQAENYDRQKEILTDHIKNIQEALDGGAEITSIQVIGWINKLSSLPL